MEWLVERTVHQGMVGTIIRKKESFIDLDFADDVACWRRCCLLLVLALEVMNVEA